MMKVSSTITLVIAMLLAVTSVGAGEIHDAVQSGDLAQVKALLAQSPELLNEKSRNNLTPLNLAAMEGRTEIVAYLLAAGADMSLGDNENSKPLHNAAARGQTEVIRLLLDRGADVNVRDDNQMTPLLFALIRYPEAARLLIERGADIKAQGSRGWPPLLYAVIGGHRDIAELLIERGANVNEQGNDGIAPLHSASSFGRDSVFQLLIDKGARIDVRNEHGETPLCYALNANCLDEARTLIERGADVNIRTEANRTPLHSAAQRGTVAIAELLLANGAEINAADDAGWTPLTMAAISDRPADIMKFLILKGANVNPPVIIDKEAPSGCRNIMTPLHMAAANGRLEAAEILVENGAKVNVLDDRGLTPLHNAVGRGQGNMAEYLLSHGAFVNCKEDNLARTELHTAAKQGRRDLVELLIKEGANPSAEDNEGRTPVDLAFYHGFSNLAYFMLAAGGDDSSVRQALERPPLLQKELADKEAAVWYLGHSGWAVKTKNNLLVFDYCKMPGGGAPPESTLACGYINPAQLRELNVTVFSSHDHWDHYDTSMFQWKAAMPTLQCVLGFSPDVDQSLYTYVGPRSEATVNGMKISTIRSTDRGVGFLVEVDGLVILHAGDHANGQVDLSGAYPVEIDYLAEKGLPVDLAFFGITGCSLGDPVSVARGVDYAIEKLTPKVLFPMHAGGEPFRYLEYA
ncbi:MAG: ankyrin repeat domain-containing protein, partial [candidate division Zixibacteria bacterium]|nr:ankyrin repeat domain-containing protein [candidate division Zixibacteria bacterium]